MSATKVIGTVDRYKRPVMKIKVEGRDKMVTTIILNMVQVAKALQVPPAYPTKFFSLKRGCQCNPGPEVYSVAGSHSLTDLENLLEEFINLCVLCPKCTLPETVMKVKKGAITRTCRACSYTGNLSVDTKLDSFILKNPPPKVKDLVARPSAAAGPSSSSGGAGGGDDEGMGDINIEAPDMSTVAIVDDGWAVDVSDAAAEERRRKEMGASAVIQAMLEHDADWTIDRSAEELTKWFEAERAKVTASSTTSSTSTTTAASTGGAPAITKELVEATIAKGENLGRVHEHSSVEVLGLVLHVVWNEDAIKRFEVFEPIFKRLVKDAKGQRVVLGNIERLSSTHKALLPVLTNLFTKLYEGDYLEEEVIAKWASKVESKYVDTAHAKAVRTSIAPFLKFLEEDESEDDDEEGDDDDDNDDEDGDGDEDDDDEEEEEEDDEDGGDARVPQGADDDEEEDDDGFNDDEEALALKAKSAGAGARGGAAGPAAAKSPSGKGSSGAGAGKSAPPPSSTQSGKGKAASGPPPSSTAASRGKAPAAKPESDSEELDLDAI